MASIFVVVLSNTLTAGAIGVAAALVMRFSRRPAVAHALWVIALVKLLTPPVWTVPISRLSPVVEPIEGRFVSQTTAGNVIRGNTPVAPGRGIRAGGVVIAVWIIGSVVCAAVTAVRVRRFGKLLRYGKPSDATTERQAAQIAAAMGMKSAPPIRLIAGEVYPMLWATPGRAMVVLPMALWASLAEKRRGTLLAHELAHLRRGDHRVRWLETVATVVYWWNPVLWLAREGLHEAEEACCDAWVARTIPGACVEYAGALVDAIEYAARSGGGGSVVALGSGIGGFRSLQRRLLMISEGTTRATTGRLGGAAVCLALLVLPLAYGYAQQPATRPSSAQSVEDAKLNAATAARLKRDLPAVVTDDVGFVDAVAFFHDVSGVEFVVMWDQVKAAGVGKNNLVRLNLQKANLGEAIDQLLASAAGKPGVLTYTVDRGKIVIAPAHPPTTQPK